MSAVGFVFCAPTMSGGSSSERSPAPAQGKSKYTHGHSAPVLKSHKWRTAVNSAAYLLPHLNKSSRVLDVGCGPGTITADFARICTDGTVIGVDAAESIVSHAAVSFPNDSFPNLSFHTASVMEKMPFENGAFDVVHAHQVLQHVPDPVAALKEMRRVCASGGIVAARDADYAGMVWAPDNEGIDAWMVQYQRITRENGGDPNCGRNLRRYAKEAGFEEVVPSASLWYFATPAERSWWGNLSAERVKNSDFADQMRETLPESALDEMVEGWLTWSEDECASFSIPNGEIICTA